ncbi:DUF6911 family protein [Pantoea agglomerans]|uniref:DUF6911 family protein n=1 Tax=Enterobacter agglomerans TaxID=549 RepID=UPI0017839F67|nr:hypothetical protein [Pantoea agglomerans]MBD8133833.1 hypothetical protein [Pantoea agglomerans]
MMMHYELSRLCFGEKYVKIESPSLFNVIDFLNILKNRDGNVNIRIINGPDIGPERLSVEAEKGFYLLTLLEYDESESNVRFLWNKDSSSEESVMILGHYWPKRQLTKDFDLIIRIFKEFYYTGNVCTNVLS